MFLGPSCILLRAFCVAIVRQICYTKWIFHLTHCSYSYIVMSKDQSNRQQVCLYLFWNLFCDNLPRINIILIKILHHKRCRGSRVAYTNNSNLNLQQILLAKVNVIWTSCDSSDCFPFVELYSFSSAPKVTKVRKLFADSSSFQYAKLQPYQQKNCSGPESTHIFLFICSNCLHFCS